MRILVACEFSGAVRSAFRAAGHDAWSCDLEPAEDGSAFHFTGDVRYRIKTYEWDMLIAFPPCTFLASSGARWWKDRQEEQREALNFVHMLMNAPIPKIAIENPIGKISTAIRRPDQIVQPWWFGHGETKATCLWLKNIPKLVPSNIVEGRQPRVHWLSPSDTRSKERSRTLKGFAAAMAAQWGQFR